MEPDALTPGSSPYYDFVYNNESVVQPTYWPLIFSQMYTKRAANELYTDDPSEYITYSGSWQSLLVAREKEGRYRNFSIRAYSGDSFNFYISIPSGQSAVYYAGPLSTSGNYSVLTEYALESDAQVYPVLFEAAQDNVQIYTLPTVKAVDWIRLHHESVASGQAYRLYQFLPRTLIQVDDLEADVIDAVTIRVSDSIVVSADDLAPGSITGEKILAGTISGVLITPGTITTNLIAVSGIDADRINVNTLSALSTNTGSLNVTGTITVSGVGSEIDAGYTKITQSGISIGNTFTELNDTNALKIYGLIPSGGGNVIGMAIYNNLQPLTPHAIFQTDFDNALEIENLAVDGVTNINIPQGPIENAFNVWVYEGIPVDEFSSIPQFSVGDYYTDIRNDLRLWGSSLDSPQVILDAIGLQTESIKINGLAEFYNRADISGSGILMLDAPLVIKNADGTPVTTLFGSGGAELSGTILASGFRASQDGTSSVPAFSWGSDTDTGFFRYGAGAIGVTANTTLSTVFVGSQLQVSDGTQSVPGLSFINDQDTGIYRPTTNTLTLVASGVAQLTATNTGVDVGGFLSVNSSSLVVTNALDTGDIAGGGTLSTLHYDQTGSSLNLFRSSDNTTSNFLDVYKSRGTRSSNSASTAGDSILLIRSYAYQSNGTYDEVARITSATVTDPDAGVLRFSTAPTGGAITERMTITSDGNVGIATNSPATSARLEIASTTGALLVPRMTTTQRNALTAANGMIIYNTTTATLQGYQNNAWTNL